MGADLLEGDVELTEFEKIDVRTIKGVKQGANGFPILMMKGLAGAAPVAKGAKDCPGCGKTYDADSKQRKCENCGADLPDADDASKADGAAEKSGPPDWHAPAAQLARLGSLGQFPLASAWPLLKAVDAAGKVDEQPDIDGGKQAIALIAKLIGYEAQELEAGCLGETWDIQLLCEAAGALKCWLSGEVATQMAETSDGTGVVMDSVDDAAKAAQSAASKNDLPDSAFAYIEDGGTKDADGKTTPRSKRHFPIHDKAHADNAAARIAQGAQFGDQAKAKVAAAQKKFGESDASKSADVADGGTAVDTDAQGTGGLEKAVEDALAKATAPLRAEIESLQAFKAKVEALPVPGGPVMSAVRAQVRGEGNEDWAAKAAYFRDMADTVTDRPTADGYRKLAREAEDKARTAAPAAITS